MAAPPRRRPLVAMALVAVVVSGWSSRRFPALVPALLGKYPGDALWALMVYLALAFVAPGASVARLALGAFAISTLVETLQLLRAPWLVAIRETTLGHLALGSTFAWRDLAAYAVGVTGGALLDWAITRTRAGAATARHRVR